MAVAVSAAQAVFSSSSFNGTSAWTPSFSNISAGSTIVVAFSWANSSRPISSVVANGTSNTTLTVVYDQPAVAAYRQAYAVGTLAADCTSITFTVSGGTISNVRGYMSVLTVTALAASPFDGGNVLEFTSVTSFDSGAVTPSIADALIIGQVQGSSSSGYIQPAGAGWTTTGFDTTADDNGRADYKVVSSTAAVNYVPTNATSESGIVSICCFKGISSGGATRRQYVVML